MNNTLGSGMSHLEPSEFMKKIEEMLNEANLTEEWVFCVVLNNIETGEGFTVSSKQIFSAIMCAGVLAAESTLRYKFSK